MSTPDQDVLRKLETPQCVLSKVIALLGRREIPIDGVDDNCTFLASSLSARGYRVEKERVEWAECGWLRALIKLWHDSVTWSDSWVVLQFTSLAWSRRGFPFGALAVILLVRWRGAHAAVFYHEPTGVISSRLIDKIRRRCQEFVIRRLYSLAECALFADPLNQISWLPVNRNKAKFVPVGANVPDLQQQTNDRSGDEKKNVSVYCIDGPPYRAQELADILHAIRFVSGNGLSIRLMFFGKGTEEAKTDIQRLFGSLPVELLNFGVQPAEEVARLLAASDAMLFVRGRITPRRSSAIAAIASGTPIVAYAGECEGTHVAAAGVHLVPYRDSETLGQALYQLLKDHEYWETLRRRNLCVYQEYLSWNAIADRFIRALGL